MIRWNQKRFLLESYGKRILSPLGVKGPFGLCFKTCLQKSPSSKLLSNPQDIGSAASRHFFFLTPMPCILS